MIILFRSLCGSSIIGREKVEFETVNGEFRLLLYPDWENDPYVEILDDSENSTENVNTPISLSGSDSEQESITLSSDGDEISGSIVVNEEMVMSKSNNGSEQEAPSSLNGLNKEWADEPDLEWEEAEAEYRGMVLADFLGSVSGGEEEDIMNVSEGVDGTSSEDETLADYTSSADEETLAEETSSADDGMLADDEASTEEENGPDA